MMMMMVLIGILPLVSASVPLSAFSYVPMTRHNTKKQMTIITLLSAGSLEDTSSTCTSSSSSSSCPSTPLPNTDSTDSNPHTSPNGVSRRAFGKAALLLLPLLSVSLQPQSAVASSKVDTTTHSVEELACITTNVTDDSNLDFLFDSSLDDDNDDDRLLEPQFDTANDIPADYFEKQRYIYGFVERVIDGDTIRVRHIPGYKTKRAFKPEPLQQRGIANVTLSIRIYGVDAPETGKNKRQTGMPFGEEAKQFTTDLVYHQMVKITLLRRDQYNRAVAVVETVPTTAGLFGVCRPRPRDVSWELARAGLAELYTGGGAEYYGRRTELEAAITAAQRAQRGIWSLDGKDGQQRRQSAAEYKRQQKQQQTQQVVVGVPRGGGDRASSTTNAQPLMALTGLSNQQQSPLKQQQQQRRRASKKPTTTQRVLVAGTSKPTTVSHPKVKSSRSSNKENLLDAVITGLEFLG